MPKNPFSFNPFSDQKFDFTKNIPNTSNEIDKKKKVHYEEDELMRMNDQDKQTPHKPPPEKSYGEDEDSIPVIK